MEIIGTIPFRDIPVEFSALRFDAGGSVREMASPLQTESLLDVFINDAAAFRLTCSASDLVELVVGRLYTEGIIAGTDDIDALSICEQAMRADVYLHDRSVNLAPARTETVPTCCTGNRTLVDYSGGRPLEAVSPVTWMPAAVFALAAEFEADKTSHARTKGVHSAILADLQGTPLALCEDIGRHNAFDKAVGSALISATDLTRCMLFTSGRVPTDMVAKAIRARIPVLISKAVATDQTIALAREYGLTLICTATSSHFDVLCDSALSRRLVPCAG